jgi:lipopolysaccharide export system protein LptA
MNKILIVALFLTTSLFGAYLKIKADSFRTDQSKGLSVFSGNVKIVKSNDELNASQVTVYTDENNQPTKFIAIGNVSFKINTKDNSEYEGTANKVIYKPLKKEYYFYENVLLKQINEKKEIEGDEVILNTADGKAYAKGLEKKPVIMTFDIAEEKE